MFPDSADRAAQKQLYGQGPNRKVKADEREIFNGKWTFISRVFFKKLIGVFIIHRGGPRSPEQASTFRVQSRSK